MFPPRNEVTYPTKQETRKKSSTQTFPSFRPAKCLCLGGNKICHPMTKPEKIFKGCHIFGVKKKYTVFPLMVQKSLTTTWNVSQTRRK